MCIRDSLLEVLFIDGFADDGALVTVHQCLDVCQRCVLVLVLLVFPVVLGTVSYTHLLLAGMGLGLLLGYLICYATIPNYFTADRDWMYREPVSLIYGACVLGVGGIGLIVAFITELKLNKK